MSFYKRFIQTIVCVLIFFSSYTHAKTVQNLIDESENKEGLEYIFDLEKQLDDLYRKALELIDQKEQAAEFIREHEAWKTNVSNKFNSVEEVTETYRDIAEELSAIVKPRLEKIISVFYNGEPNIDYNDPRLNTAFEKFPLEICHTYKALINYTRQQKTNGNKITENNQDYKLSYRKIYSGAKSEDEPNYQSSTPIGKILEDLLVNVHYSVYPENYYFADFGKIPLWLVLEFPEILLNMGDRFSPGVLATKSLHNIKEVEEFIDLVNGVLDMHYADNRYCWRGTIIIDLRAQNRNTIDMMSFAPQLILEKPKLFFTEEDEFSAGQKLKFKTVEENLINLKAWSLRGIWNRLTYNKFVTKLQLAVKPMQSYYQQNYNLAKYAPEAELLLSHYIITLFPDTKAAEAKVFKVVNTINGSIEECQKNTNDFTKAEWNEILHMAILADFPKETIEWIIKQGANINHIYEFETAVMNSVTRT
jgi:hypothetical protein